MRMAPIAVVCSVPARREYPRIRSVGCVSVVARVPRLAPLCPIGGAVRLDSVRTGCGCWFLARLPVPVRQCLLTHILGEICFRLK